MAPTVEYLNFEQALSLLKQGKRVACDWNRKGMFVTLQFPDANSKMTSAYLYITVTDLEDPNTIINRIPWIPSQTDLLAEDWYEVKE